MGDFKTVKTVIILGSGGHTTEMIEIVKNLNKSVYTPRYYVTSKTDATSHSKIKQIESADSLQTFEILRSRSVHQSYLTSIFTTILAIMHCLSIIWSAKPDLVLCNGPGTCVPVCLVAYVYKKLRIIPKCKIVFVESFCRVKTLSLSGKILLKVSDLFIVQWPELQNYDCNIKYFGTLI